MENWQRVHENNFFNRFHKSSECGELVKEFAEILKPLFQHSMQNLPVDSEGKKYGDAAASWDECNLIVKYRWTISRWEGAGTYIDDVPDENIFMHFNAEFLELVKQYVSAKLLKNKYDVLITAEPRADRNSCEMVAGLRVGYSEVW